MLKQPGSTTEHAVAWLASARRTLATERAGLDQLLAAFEASLGGPYVAAVDAISRARGRIILTGVGKSGHIARKIAATMASTGTPAIFVHAAEASHGDLGMITADDVLIAVSNSGETQELHDILAYSRRFSVTLIAITARAGSTLATAADIVLLLPAAEEACPIGLAPTTSSVLQMAIGDALAITLLEAKGFTAADFQRYHPGGRLGAALVHVSEIMHTGSSVPLAAFDADMASALITMTAKRFGCLGVVDSAGDLIGIITDGDLRRHMGDGLLARVTREIMTPSPKVVSADTLASSALEMLNTNHITSLFVTDGRRPVGIVHVHDLLRIGVR